MIGKLDKVEKKVVNHSDAANAFMSVLVGPSEGWDDYVMRVVTLEEGGHTPRHDHPWEHINYVLEGDGIIMIDGKDNHVSNGSYAYVPKDTIHQYRNNGNTPFKFICIVKKEGHKT